ncbi:hypothetical protein SAMN00790413_00725 [Deinococcus hopiensis KR-140]|uniref:Uncharacterized protein n=2 Tax=Deinococcus TaxID=1298 RepID=A0A1W1VAL8_9DEIO|nr:hypothetical protein SAMN00790413_00725 [Deinococcus hopiensis KR-140]
MDRVRRGAERVQRRGEEVAQSTRLRLEVFQLNRELDSLYARLGRSYHGGADAEMLEGIREEIRRVDEEIQARERLITELNAEPVEGEEEPQEPGHSSIVRVSAEPSAVQTQGAVPTSTSAEPTIPDAMPRPGDLRLDKSGD